jgi:hypothetical protein
MDAFAMAEIMVEYTAEAISSIPSPIANFLKTHFSQRTMAEMV